MPKTTAKNRLGPRREPSGTPLTAGDQPEVQPLIRTLWRVSQVRLKERKKRSRNTISCLEFVKQKSMIHTLKCVAEVGVNDFKP